LPLPNTPDFLGILLLEKNPNTRKLNIFFRQDMEEDELSQARLQSFL
jgi:hypothetical protein